MAAPRATTPPPAGARPRPVESAAHLGHRVRHPGPDRLPVHLGDTLHEVLGHSPAPTRGSAVGEPTRGQGIRAPHHLGRVARQPELPAFEVLHLTPHGHCRSRHGVPQQFRHPDPTEPFGGDPARADPVPHFQTEGHQLSPPLRHAHIEGRPVRLARQIHDRHEPAGQHTLGPHRHRGGAAAGVDPHRRLPECHGSIQYGTVPSDATLYLRAGV